MNTCCEKRGFNKIKKDSEKSKRFIIDVKFIRYTINCLAFTG